jgi:sigma-B regulation protein RsbU (phosphoserine phosphatase)
LQGTGPAAGALAEADYTSDSISFEPGDIIVLYTDGATEARSEGKFLGTDGLRKIVGDHIRRNLGDLAKAVLGSVRSYAKGHLRDDVAVLVIKARVPGELF